ncbi:hypothetical protein LEMLEM_LOCUS8130 [Lemmus lemmus]
MCKLETLRDEVYSFLFALTCGFGCGLSHLSASRWPPCTPAATLPYHDGNGVLSLWNWKSK